MSKILKISLNSVEDVKEFVNLTGKMQGEATITSGKYVIDAKSIMGIFTLDREQPMLLETETEDSAAVDALTKALGKFLAKPVMH